MVRIPSRHAPVLLALLLVALPACRSTPPRVSAPAVRAVVPAAPATEQARLVSELNQKLSAYPEASATPFGSNAVLLTVPSHVLFRFDSQALSADGVGVVAALGEGLKGRGGASCEVSVYTDVIGGASDNTTLARHRSEGLVAQLVADGVASPRLQANGAGPTKPLVANDTPEGRRQNRRVTFLIKLG
ncbi:MAG: OmpA family protein [Steroidobacteraceae bacterium]